ncbi:DUF222 domain-containing protein [Williamsia sp. CHRR-6]|nr:DUF222 domain-containing protein [Williamsia sp. CHRR-6]
MFDQAAPEGLSDRELTDRVVGHATQIAALTARFLDLLRVFDERGVWTGAGIRSCAHWLSWKTGLSLRTAQDHLRIAHALTELPLLRAAFAQGRLSYSKVRAVTRVATPDRETELLTVAISATAAQVERVVRSIAHIDRAQDEYTAGRVDSSARWRWCDDGTLAVTMRLSPVDGARFLAGVVRSEYERTRTTGDPDVPIPTTTRDGDGEEVVVAAKPDLWRHVPANIADAVIVMADAARTAIAMPEFAPGAEIVIHTDSATDSSVDAHLDDGPPLTAAEVDAASCGGSTRTIGHAPRPTRGARRGVALTFGRKRRLPTHALLRVVFERDRGCRHPVCGRTRHLHAHHVRFWRDGGTTDPDNLIMLCSTHHQALHHGVFTIEARGNQQFSFHRPDGTLIDTAPTLAVTGNWLPNTTLHPTAITPIEPGPLDLAYTIEVLYGIWDHTPSRHPIAA